jgi:hypothetical protein
MTSDEIYQYAGFFFIILIAIYLLIKIMKFQSNAMEGFGLKTAKSSISSLTNLNSSQDLSTFANTISDNATTLAATLDSTKTQMYEDILSALDQSLDVTILTTILNSAESISADPTSQSSQTIMTNMNNIISFQAAVAQAVKVINTA